MQRPTFDPLARRAESSIIRTPPVRPLPVINDQPPLVLVFDLADVALELAYERVYCPGGPLVRRATRKTSLYWIPRLTPVFAVSEGLVVYACEHSDGHAIVIDHCNGWATVYSRLAHMFVAPTDRRPRPYTRVCAGDMLGYVGSSARPLRPLRFELWKCNREHDYEAVDPLRHLRQWRQLGWRDARLERATARVA